MLATFTDDVIFVENLVVDCVIGIYPRERTEPQPLSVNIALSLEPEPSLRRDRIEQSLDYARLCGDLTFILQSSKFELIEHAAEALCSYILAPVCLSLPQANVQSVSLCLGKPQALRSGCPSIQISRHQKQRSSTRDLTPFGYTECLYESESAGLYRVTLAPFQAIQPHLHRTMSEFELMLSDQIQMQEKIVQAGTGYEWPPGWAHAYTNPSDSEQVVLRVTRPPYCSDDEHSPLHLAITSRQGRLYYPTKD
jgi:FolB domain-containing protein